MSEKCVQFSNPENLPVEKLTLEVKNAGVVQQIKALDPYWVENRPMTLYERPPYGNELVIGAITAWTMKMELFLENLKWLLSMEQYRFWSTVVYHPCCMDSLVSFLQEARPPYIPPHDCREVDLLYAEIRRFVLIVFSRLITNKESKSQWMTKEYMADLIYEKYLFSIPILWDLCLVYGADNSQHISRLVTSVFTLQPRYKEDATVAVTFVNETFKYIILRVNNNYDSDEPPNLPEEFQGFGEIRRPSNSKPTDKLNFSVLKDLVIHLLDTAMTLRIFAEVYPGSVQIFRQTKFVDSVVQIYEYGIPLLYDKLEEVGDKTSVSYVELEGYIDSARSELIDVFREMLAAYKNGILSSEGKVADHVEGYLTVLMEGLSEELLVRDYHACYPLNEDLELLRQAYPDLDEVKTNYILQAIYANMDEPIPEYLKNAPVTNGYDVASTNEEPGPSTSGQSAPATELIPDSVRQESLIREVIDVLPHLGDGFVLKCLEHYDFDTQRVISSILEQNLAEPLRNLDQSLPIIPDDPLDQKFLETGIARLNVFDGDEFDIMTRDDVDVSRIHVGKRRSKYKNWKELLDDKSDSKVMEDIYNRYNLVRDTETLYSDEYEDMYDSDGGSADGGADARRPDVTPRVLQPRRREQQDDAEEESDHEDQKPGSSKNRMDFCTNPEEARARREANFQARRGRGHRAPPPKTADVTGKPRGQGQEKDVLVSREKKEKHKSSRANHSRRQGAQWKRSQGMMPS